MKIAIVDKDSLSIVCMYVADHVDPSKFGGPWGYSNQFVHVESPSNIQTSDDLKVVKTGNVITVELK